MITKLPTYSIPSPHPSAFRHRLVPSILQCNSSNATNPSSNIQSYIPQPQINNTQPLQLPLQQVGDHLAPSDARGSPQGREVQGAGESIGVAEEEHGRDPATGVLEREAGRVHLVLLDLAALQVVHGAGRVDLGLVLAGHVGKLGAGEDVEVVVRGVAAGVALGADGGAEDDQVLGDT